MFVHTYLRWARRCIAASLAAPVLILACTYYLYYVHDAGARDDFMARLPERLLQIGPALAVLAAAGAALFVVLRRLDGAGDDAARMQVDYADAISGRRLDFAIAAAAGLSLFLELIVIRWQVSVFPVLAFYKNFGLFACFAGLGLGYALAARDRIPLIAAVPLLAWQIVFFIGLKFGLGEGRMASAMASPVSEQLNMGVGLVRVWFQYIVIYYTLGVVFALTVFVFVPIGQLCGRLMSRTGNLRAYGLNLAGSLAGVLAVHALSFLWTPPLVWFGIAFAALLAFQAYHRGVILFTGTAALLAMVAMAWPVAPVRTQIVYSPYQIIEREYTPDGLTTIRTSGHFLQRVHNLTPSGIAMNPDEREARMAQYYELPHRIAGPRKSLVVVGAGTGNDVAAALRMGVGEVTAVEIDPAIVEIGRVAHPENPYGDSRVRTVVNDARSFFRHDDGVYDMIAYGMLDSHSALSNSASVRLDSFVYTVQGFEETRARLADDGFLSLSFNVLSPELGQKIFLMLRDAFDGREPVCLKSQYGDTYYFLQSASGPVTVDPAVLADAQFEDITARLASGTIRTDVSTDDWPFFYMPRRVYPFSYLGIISLVLLVTLAFVALLAPGRPEPGHAVFFFLGAGFMLVETKGITELGLQFGNTWHVIGIIIAGILVMALGANAAVKRFEFRRAYVPFALLLVSLGIGYAGARAGGMPSTAAGRIGAVALLTCPVFFSGVVFSTLLRDTQNIAGAMSANLLGAMCGGMLENNALRFGYSSMYLIAAMIYVFAAASWVLSRRRGRRSAGVSMDSVSTRRAA